MNNKVLDDTTKERKPRKIETTEKINQDVMGACHPDTTAKMIT